MSDIVVQMYLTQKDRDRIAHEKQFEEFDKQIDNFRREREESLIRRAEESARFREELDEADVEVATMKRTVEEGA